MDLAVSRLSSRLVKPSLPPPYPFSTLPSCKLDLVIANIYVKTVFFFRNTEGFHDFLNRDLLVQSLEQVLSYFYPFAGTITGDLDVDCNGNGALLVESVADCTIDDLGDLTPNPALLKLVPTLDESSRLTSRPLLLLQFTEFKCGGVAMGMALEHHVGDGVSALNFLKAWSSLARGETMTSFPFFDKAWLRGRTPPRPQFVHDEYLKLPQPLKKEIHCFDKEHEPTVRMFDIPQEFLQKLKRGSAGTSLTTYEILAAHVWRCCSEARMLADEEKSILIMAIDGRARLNKVKDAQNFCGNVIFNCCLTLSAGEILQSSVRTLASRIRCAVRRMDEEYTNSALDFLETCSRAELASFVKGPHTFASPNLGFISWTKFPFYEIDFGWGNAAHVGPVHVPWEGHAYLLASPSSSRTRSLRLCINLQRLHMHKFSDLLLHLDS